VLFPLPVRTGSTGRFAGFTTIFSAILNASAEIVKDELTPKMLGQLPHPPHIGLDRNQSTKPHYLCILFQSCRPPHDLYLFPYNNYPKPHL
jgi:hypothetical protein